MSSDSQTLSFEEGKRILGTDRVLTCVYVIECLIYVLICGMINITFFVVDSLVDWLKCLILKTVVFLFNCFFYSVYKYLVLLNNSDSCAVGRLLKMLLSISHYAMSHMPRTP